MVSVASQLIEEVTAHAQSDSLEDAREICADGTYFPNNLHSIPLRFRQPDLKHGTYSTSLWPQWIHHDNLTNNNGSIPHPEHIPSVWHLKSSSPVHAVPSFRFSPVAHASVGQQLYQYYVHKHSDVLAAVNILILRKVTVPWHSFKC